MLFYPLSYEGGGSVSAGQTLDASFRLPGVMSDSSP